MGEKVRPPLSVCLQEYKKRCVQARAENQTRLNIGRERVGENTKRNKDNARSKKKKNYYQTTQTRGGIELVLIMC